MHHVDPLAVLVVSPADMSKAEIARNFGSESVGADEDAPACLSRVKRARGRRSLPDAGRRLDEDSVTLMTVCSRP